MTEKATYGSADSPVAASMAQEAQDPILFDSIFGALKGTVTVKPGTDLTQPASADWDAAR